MKPIHLLQWIAEHRELLKPPVGNKTIYQDSEFIIMVIGGPNSRTDYHHDPGEEFFYQIEGDIVLKIVREGRHEDVFIQEGEIFLLPAGIPHSPRRPADTIGMVIERRRRPEEQDGFLWYCESCGRKLHEEFLHISDIETQLAPVFDRFYRDADHSTCKQCGTRVTPPA